MSALYGVYSTGGNFEVWLQRDIKYIYIYIYTYTQTDATKCITLLCIHAQGNYRHKKHTFDYKITTVVLK